DERDLLVIPALRLDTGGLAQTRLRAISGHNELRRHACGPILAVDCVTNVLHAIAQLKAVDAGRRDQPNRSLRKPLPERGAHRAIRRNVAERLQAELARIETREPETTLVGDVNTADARRVMLHQRPHAERLERATASVRQRGRTIVEARLIATVECSRLDQDDAQIELCERKRERGTHEAAAADGDVVAVCVVFSAHIRLRLPLT